MRLHEVVLPIVGVLAVATWPGVWLPAGKTSTSGSPVTWKDMIPKGTRETKPGRVSAVSQGETLKQTLFRQVRADAEEFRKRCGADQPNRTRHHDFGKLPRPTPFAQKHLMSTPLNGLFQLNPAVHRDHHFQKYPDLQSTAVRNALFFADLFQTLFTVRGFEILCKGRPVGLLPSIYMGFPKTGSTSAYSFLERSNPCVVTGLDKETNFWIYGIRPVCTVSENLTLTWCDPGKIINATITWAGLRLKGAESRQEKNQCQHPFVVDGSQALLWDMWMHLDLGVQLEVIPARCPRLRHAVPGTGMQPRRPLLTDMQLRCLVLTWHCDGRHCHRICGWQHMDRFRHGVPFDVATFLRAVTPDARFLVLVRENDADQLRSHFWFFAPKASLPDYHSSLRSVLTHLQDISNGYNINGSSTCAAMLRSRTFAPFPRVNSMASSCNVLPYAALFGPQSIFATDISSLLSCQDRLFAWIAASVRGADTAPSAQRLRRVSSTAESAQLEHAPSDSGADQRLSSANASLPARSTAGTAPVRMPGGVGEGVPCSPRKVRANARSKDRRTYPEATLQLEQQVLSALQRVAPPLLRPGAVGAMEEGGLNGGVGGGVGAAVAEAGRGRQERQV